MSATLHVGFKPVEKKLGFVAESCPTCRKPCVCELTALGRRPTLYLVLPAGRMTVLGHQAKCCECGRVFTAEAAFYPYVAREAGRLEDLLARTNPTLAGDG